MSSAYLPAASLGGATALKLDIASEPRVLRLHVQRIPTTRWQVWHTLSRSRALRGAVSPFLVSGLLLDAIVPCFVFFSAVFLEAAAFLGLLRRYGGNKKNPTGEAPT